MGGSARSGRDSPGAKRRRLAEELRDLLHRPTTLVVLGAVVALVGLTHLLAGVAVAQLPGTQGGQIAAMLTFPDAYRAILALLVMFGGMVAAAYAGAIGGNGSTRGILRIAVARDEGGPEHALAGFAAIAILVLIGLLLAFGWGILTTIIGASIAGLPTAGVFDPSTLAELPALIVRAWWSIVTLAAIGYAAGIVTRSRAAGLGVAAGLLLGEQAGSLVVSPDVLRLAPVSSTSLLVGATAPHETELAFIVATLYLVGSLVVAAVVDRRATRYQR